MVTVDSDGDVVNSYTYDVFGETRSESGAQANEFQFAGQQVDGSTGLQYLRARYLDMETGRFISRDPLMDGGGWSRNPYAYASDSPAMRSDPTGLCDWWIVNCIDDAVSGLGGLLKGSYDALQGAISSGGSKLRGAWDSFTDSLKSAVSGLANSIAKLPKEVAQLLEPIIDHLFGDLQRLVEKSDALLRGCARIQQTAAVRLRFSRWAGSQHTQ